MDEQQLNSVVVFCIILGAAAVLLLPGVRTSKIWRAMMTPLASIIGSGFLVLGPLLLQAYGAWAPIAMLALCVVAYLFGGAVRYNINVIGQDDTRPPLELSIDTLSSWVLACAYVISVAYYLNLFGSFGMGLTPLADPFHSRLLASAALVTVAMIGLLRGFSGLERTEQIAVGIKLAIIAGLLGGFAMYFGERAALGTLGVTPPSLTGLPAVALLFGLLVTVQGFETSRYLGDTYDPAMRIRSMRFAQWMSSAIYMVYVLLIVYVFDGSKIDVSETAIIQLTAIVAPALPALLVVAALGAQMSAALADTGGSGGLVHELSSGRIPLKPAYVVMTGLGLILTWSLDVFAIISIASRAFALYYALQSAIAAISARRIGAPVLVQAGFAALAVLGGAIAVFGTSVE